jgi:hypothetical protein
MTECAADLQYVFLENAATMFAASSSNTSVVSYFELAASAEDTGIFIHDLPYFPAYKRHRSIRRTLIFSLGILKKIMMIVF